MQRGSMELMKKMNQKIILKLIHDKKAVSRAKIAEIANLAPSTVTNIVNELIEIGLVKECEKGQSRGGRKPILLELNPSGFYVIGFEWEVAEIKAVLMNLNKDIIKRIKVPTESNEYEFFVDKSVDIIQSFKDFINDQNKLFGVGLGIHGLVNSKEGISLFAPYFNWDNINIKEKLSKKINLPVLIDNDVNMMAYAEKWEGKEDFIFIYTGYGIGSAIVLNGQLYHGKNWSAGEFGHMTIVEDGPICICGSRGCLNVLISVNELIKKYNKALDDNISYLKVKEEWSKLINAAHKEDKRANNLLVQAGKYLGTGIANVVNLLNPQSIIIGGDFTEAEDIMFPVIEKQLKKDALKAALNDIKITSTKFGEEVGAIGAATGVLEEIFKLKENTNKIIK